MAFPADPLDVTVELLLGDTWTDITEWVEIEESLIGISRGRGDEASRVDPSSCTFVVDNRDGRFSPDNPMGPWYGLITRNTPQRVTVEGARRYVGEVPDWRTRLDDTGADPAMPGAVAATGILRRINQGATPLRSVMYRELLQLGHVQAPIAYWPCEDGSDTTALWSALPNRRPMTIADGLQPSSYSGFACSESIPVLADTQFFGNVRGYDTSAGVITALCLVHLPDDGLAEDGSSLMVCNGTGSGSYWRVQANVDRTVRLQVADDEGTVLSTSGNSTFTIGTAGALVILRLIQSGANTFYGVRVYNVGADAVESLTGTLSNRTFGRINRITIGATHNLGQTAVGHVALFTGQIADARYMTAVNAHLGEAAGRRIERICLEEGIPLGVVGDLDDTHPMGPQRARPATELLHEGAAVDRGILHEPVEVSRDLGTFETSGSTDGWVGAGDDPPAVAGSTTRAHTGTRSMLITWAGGSDTQIVRQDSQPEMFIPGHSYTWSCWVWVPTGDSAVAVAVGGIGIGESSTLTDTWEQLSYTWVATATDNQPQLWAVVPAGAGDQVWVDDITITTDRPGLAYRTGRGLYLQSASLDLDFQLGHLAPALEPVSDDQHLANDVSITRTSAATARAVVEDGPMSVREHPNGVGRYTYSETVNLLTDEQAEQLAAWEAYLGTRGEPRYRELVVDLVGTPELIPQVLDTDIGDRITVANPPIQITPWPIDQLAQGYDETIGNFDWTVAYTCTPARPYDVATVDARRCDSLYSTLDAGIDEDDTTLPVAVETGRAAWTTDVMQFPIDITVGGEDMSVTAIGEPVGGVQEFTVVRSVNGVIKSHGASTEVRLAFTQRAYVAR
ncbi:carbohydrate binding domain-containing protein [Actinophytocola sediminis]